MKNPLLKITTVGACLTLLAAPVVAMADEGEATPSTPETTTTETAPETTEVTTAPPVEITTPETTTSETRAPETTAETTTSKTQQKAAETPQIVKAEITEKEAQPGDKVTATFTISKGNDELPYVLTTVLQCINDKTKQGEEIVTKLPSLDQKKQEFIIEDKISETCDEQVMLATLTEDSDKIDEIIITDTEKVKDLTVKVEEEKETSKTTSSESSKTTPPATTTTKRPAPAATYESEGTDESLRIKSRATAIIYSYNDRGHILSGVKLRIYNNDRSFDRTFVTNGTGPTTLIVPAGYLTIEKIGVPNGYINDVERSRTYFNVNPGRTAHITVTSVRESWNPGKNTSVAPVDPGTRKLIRTIPSGPLG